MNSAVPFPLALSLCQEDYSFKPLENLMTQQLQMYVEISDVNMIAVIDSVDSHQWQLLFKMHWYIS
jgi:hypothetical protein